MFRSYGVSAFLLLAVLSSTAAGQVVRVGPYGGVRVRAPGFWMNLPGPPIAPPFYRSPFGIAPVYGPPIPVPLYPFRYEVQRVPSYAIPAPNFRMDYYGPGGSGSISVGSSPVVSVPSYSSDRQAVSQVAYPPANLSDLQSQLYDAATRLTRSISARRDGEPWMNYLAPHRIVAALERGETTGLNELVVHYNGVVANPKLAFVANLDGFAATRSLLPQYLASLNGQIPAAGTEVIEQPPRQDRSESDSGESLLPVPTPVPLPEPQADPASEPQADPASEPNADPVPPPRPQPPADPTPSGAADGPTPAEPINPAGEPTDI